MKGPSPKPNLLKLARGVRPCRLNKREAAAVKGAPVCPRELDATGRAAWRKVVADLAAMGILSRTDGNIIAVYCAAYADWRKADAGIRKEGYAVPTARGGLITTPYWRVAREARAVMIKALVELGLTPAARTRIKPDPAAVPATAASGDELGDFLDKTGS